jgi:large subunit ribosomal protein L32
MSVPKQRHTASRKNKRRGQIYITVKSATSCPKCSKPVMPHTTCANCGFYKGKEVIDVMKKLTKKEKKAKEQEIKQTEEKK